MRTQKTVNSTTTDYYWLNGILQGQKTGNEYIIFLYDENGSAYGFLLKNGTTEAYYYYIFSAQGDVIGIIDQSGTQVVEYDYDAWGKLLSVTGTLASTIGQINPIRYRGYYFDNETGFYYLQSRYYDPETGRFLNADGQIMTGDDILGCNLFAYCGNNPIVRVDGSGHFWVTALAVTALVAVVTYAIVKTVAAVQETKRVMKEIQSLPAPTKDITDQLNQTMHNNAKYLYDYQKKNGLVKTNIEFKNKVKTGGDWDLKKDIDKTETFKYNGLVLQAQDIGNLHYGYVGASMGFTSDTLLKMAGLVQTNRTWQMYFISNGDDLRDQIYIQYGIQLFNEGK